MCSKKAEILRLKNVLADCLLYFDVQTEKEFLDEIHSISDEITVEVEDSLLSRLIQKDDEDQFDDEESESDGKELKFFLS